MIIPTVSIVEVRAKTDDLKSVLRSMKNAFSKLKTKADYRGDTIIEVMVSITILAVVLAAAYATSNRSLQNSTESGFRAQAQSFAQQQVEIIKTIAANDSTTLGSLQTIYKDQTFCIDPINLKTIIRVLSLIHI